MTQRYFLGANSGRGFASLYEHFPPEPEVFLHIIKSGPGTGKSGFMKAIARAAQERGLDVHCVLCSGDPDSLDGVYIPALGQAWMDGTAPHVREPAFFGVDSDYVNLGRFFSGGLSAEEGRRVRELSAAYKDAYREAYRALSSTAALVPPLFPADEALAAPLRELVESRLPEGLGAPAPRFLHALSCQGELWLTGEIEKLCKLIVRVDPALLPEAVKRAEERRAGGIVCRSPLQPDRTEALLLPEAGLALVDAAWPVDVGQDLSPSAPPTPREAAAEKTRRRLLSEAVELLRQAKLLHDELEAVYMRHMDFAALTAFTEEEAARLFP